MNNRTDFLSVRLSAFNHHSYPEEVMRIRKDLLHAVYQNGTSEHKDVEGNLQRISYVPREGARGQEINPHFFVRKYDEETGESPEAFKFTTWGQVEKYLQGNLPKKKLAECVF